MPAQPPDLDPVTEFRELYEREYLPVYRAVYGVVLEPAVAEDITQDAFIRAYKARHRYRPTAPPGAWLRRIAINLAISHLRRQKLARLLPGRLYTGPSHDHDYERSEARSVVEGALLTLTPKLRAAVVLHFYEGFTRDEVAAALGIPSGTVASRIAKAMALMRKKLESSDHWSPPQRSNDESAFRTG
jgi:RNA polymerase sigma-70 factor (ECF subfamily)